MMSVLNIFIMWFSNELVSTVWLPLHIVVMYMVMLSWAYDDVMYIWRMDNKDVTLRVYLKCWFGWYFCTLYVAMLLSSTNYFDYLGTIRTYEMFDGEYVWPSFNFKVPNDFYSFLEFIIYSCLEQGLCISQLSLSVLDRLLVSVIVPISEPFLSMVDQSYSLSGFNMPANETMFSLIAIYTETLGVCLLVLFVVSILLAYILDNFVAKELIWTHHSDTDFHFWWNTWEEEVIDAAFLQKKRRDSVDEFHNDFHSELLDELDTTMNSKVFRYPHVFTKEAESLLDVFFLIIPTLIIIYLLMHTVGFVYSNDINHEKLTTSFDLDIIASQWYWSYGYNIEFCNSSLLSLIGEEGDVYEKIKYDSIILMEDDDDLRLSGWMDYTFIEDEFGASHCLNTVLTVDNSPYIRLLSVDKSLVIPVNVYVNCFITSEDVIHSWSMPQLGVKVDAIPGRITNFLLYSNYTGVYYGQCSELCGVLHGFMPIELVVTTSSDFFIWMSTLRNVEVDILDGYTVLPDDTNSEGDETPSDNKLEGDNSTDETPSDNNSEGDETTDETPSDNKSGGDDNKPEVGDRKSVV